ncbi:MAG: nickel-dependent hydrogenase large subunit [Gemmatimonadota bacterium]
MDLHTIVAEARRVGAHRPWPRVVVTADGWEAAIASMVAGDLTLLGLWGDGPTVHMAVLVESTTEIAVLSLPCPTGRYPSVGRKHAAAIRPERALRDLTSLVPVGLPDERPWLDHGRWGLRHPLGEKSANVGAPPTYAFLPAEGESLHQIPVGPVHAGIIEPGHFRFTANGEAVVRLEERLGYTHKGIEGLMEGADLATAARLAGRVSGDSTVAYALAFARAVEAALEIEAPPRAARLRAVMAEVERIANHIGDIGAICNDASFGLMHAHCGVLRERVLRFAQGAFGHRLMMDAIVPGGVAVDLSADDASQLRSLLRLLRRDFQPLVELYDGTASLQDRTVGTGILKPALAGAFGASGFVGRASGRAFDARRALRYPPFDVLEFEVPVLEEGDVNARVWIRIREVEQSLALLSALADLPEGPIRRELPIRAGEGMAIAEGFRGDVLAWVRMDGEGKLLRCHLRDPSWFQWPLLEAAVEGNIVADFPLCNKSFNCSYSGHDV